MKNQLLSGSNKFKVGTLLGTLHWACRKLNSVSIELTLGDIKCLSLELYVLTALLIDSQFTEAL